MKRKEETLLKGPIRDVKSPSSWQFKEPRASTVNN